MSEASDAKLLKKVDWLREKIQEFDDPSEISKLTRLELVAENEQEFFIFSFLGEPVKLDYPDLVAYSQYSKEPLFPLAQALVIYHLYTSLTSKPTEKTGEWISFSELEDGRFYTQAFQGYTGDKLVKHVEMVLNHSDEILTRLNADRVKFGDFAFSVKIFPNVPLACVIWIGDEDFSSSCKILFDRSANSYLPTDGCAILGSMFVQQIIKIIPRKNKTDV